MTRIYVCRKCRKRHSVEEYNKSHFCRDCKTFLTPRLVRSASPSPIRRTPTPTFSSASFAARTVTKTAESQSDSSDPWLPRGYEVRKGQVDFIKEAQKALENNEVFVGSAPCGIGKSLASLMSILPNLGQNKLLDQLSNKKPTTRFPKRTKGTKTSPHDRIVFQQTRHVPPNQKTGRHLLRLPRRMQAAQRKLRIRNQALLQILLEHNDETKTSRQPRNGMRQKNIESAGSCSKDGKTWILRIRRTKTHP